MMKTAVIGCGNISQCHLSAIEKIDGVKTVAVVDIKKDRAEGAAKKYSCNAYTDYIEMLEKEKPDCVHICTPHYLHAEMTQEALRRGVNVLCEKPCAVSREELSQTEAVLKKSKARLGICFQNRYNESVAAVKNILLSKYAGKILCARASVAWNREKEYYSDDWHGKKNKEGGGVLINQAIHTLDLLRYLIGEDMKYVSGHIFNEKFFSDIDVEDTVSARFESESGIVSYFSATVGAGCDHPILIDIVCDDAVFRIEGNNAYRIEKGKITPVFVEESFDFIGKIYWGKSHERLIEDFYACLVSKRKFLPDLRQGGKAVKEVLAVYESSASGKKCKIE